MSDGAQLKIDAPLEHGFDLEESLVFRIKLGAVFNLAKGGLKNREAVTRLQDVEEILSFDTAHLRGTFASMEPRFPAVLRQKLVTSVTQVISEPFGGSYPNGIAAEYIDGQIRYTLARLDIEP